MCDYLGSRGWVQGDSAEAEVDGCGEGVEVAVAEAAALNQSDLGVVAFEAGVGQAEFDRGDDGVGVFLDSAYEVGERGDSAAFRGGAPAFEVGAGVGGIGGAVELA
jgi:hypothetical protein